MLLFIAWFIMAFAALLFLRTLPRKLRQTGSNNKPTLIYSTSSTTDRGERLDFAHHVVDDATSSDIHVGDPVNKHLEFPGSQD